MPFSLHLNSRTAEVASELQKALNATGHDLAPAALAIARVEYPSLDSKPYAAMLDRMGEEAAKRLKATTHDPIRAFNEYLYDEQRFVSRWRRHVRRWVRDDRSVRNGRADAEHMDASRDDIRRRDDLPV